MRDLSKQPFTYPAIRAVIKNYSNGRRVLLAKRIPSLRRCIRAWPICYDSVSLSAWQEFISFRLDDLEWKFIRVEHNSFEFIKHGRFIEHIPIGTVISIISHYLKRNGISVINFRIDNFPLFPDTISISEVDYLHLNLTEFREVSTYFQSLHDIGTIGCIDIYVNTPESSWVSTIEKLNIDHVKINTIQRTPDDIFDGLKNFGLLEIKEEDMSDRKFRKMCKRFKDEWLEPGCSYTGAKWQRTDDMWNRLKRQFGVDRMEKEQFTVELDDSRLEMFVQRLPAVFYTVYSVRIREYEEKTEFQQKLSRHVTEPLMRQFSNVSTCLRTNFNTIFFTVAYFLILIDCTFFHMPPILEYHPFEPDVYYTPTELDRPKRIFTFFMTHLVINFVTFPFYFRVLLEVHRRMLSVEKSTRAVFEFFSLACAFCFFAAVTYFAPLLNLYVEHSFGFSVLTVCLTLYLKLILETNRC